MRPSDCLTSALTVKKWKIYFFFPSILVCFVLLSRAELSRTSLACLSNPCIYGICIDDVNGTFSCYCIDGYTGFLCQTNWDECWSNPCLNGGTCNDGIAHYNCTCPPGYQGEFCEQNIDECNSNPCHNNGTCVDGPNGYTCICPSGYLGSFCETDVSVCNDTHETRCLNGGLCIEGPGFTFNCVCQIGWEGEFCEEGIDECASSPCLNGAVCLDLQGNYTCACPFGFSGRNCEVELEMCGETSPCQNGAVCLVEDWLRVCYCVPDFHGDRCQFQYNECLLGPGCLNGGTCIDGVDGYDCSCLPGWTGNFCECLVLEEDEMDCSYPFRPPIPSLTTSTVPTMPIWIETEVPKTTASAKATTSNFFYSFLTECLPIWPQYPIKPSQKPRFPSWITKKVTSPQVTTRLKTTKLSTTPLTTETTSIVTTRKATSMTTTEITPTVVLTTAETTPITTSTKTATKQTTIALTTTELTTTTTTMETTPITTRIETTPTKTTTGATPTTTTTETTPETTTTTTTTTETTTTTTETTTTTTETTTTTSTTETTPTTTETTTKTTTTETTPMTTTTETITTSTTMEPPTTADTTPISTTLATETTSTSSSSSSTTTATTTTTAAAVTTTAKDITKIPQPSFEPTLETTECVDSTSPFPTFSPWNCQRVPCLNGGTCLNTTLGLRCICKNNWEGPFCENKVDIKVAGFSGKSFLSHKLANTQNIRIDVTARTIASEGVILYSHLGHKIFMILYLEGGLLKFKFSCGVQTMLLSEVQFRINNGFDLVASVTLDFLPPDKPKYCSAAVRINNTLAMSGEQLARGPRADSTTAMVYIGGVPNQYVDKEEYPIPSGFIGCMQSLVIGKISKGIFKDSFDSNEITECKSLACLSSPCRSGATCVEHNNSWSCLCPSGFIGYACERSVCINNPCLFGGTCTSFPGSGFICLCPLGKQGLLCENDIQTGYPLFASSIAGYSSFAAYKLPTEIYQDMLLTFKFLPHDMEQISLMIFIGQDGYHRATSDHLAVSFIKGYVVLTWNLGSGPRRIFTQKPVPNTGRFFHTVQIGRSGKKAWLAVDNQQNITGKSPGKLTQLNTRSVVYLGGHDSRNFSLLPHDLPLHTGFSGCLFDVELRTGQMLIKIEKTPPAFSRGVGQCGKSLCNEYSCENGGGCINHGATFTCLCAEGWFGPTCAMKFNPCDMTRHNCSEGSTCVPLKQGFYCDCPVGRTGKYCEISEELSDVKLKGIRSYIALAIEGLHQFQSCIDLEIRPQNYYGLILYSGKPERNSFWSLSLQDGVLELRVSPGIHRRRGDILVIRSRRLLSLGKWHRIRVGRYGRKLFLWVEGTINTGVLLPGENLPPLGSIVYIGGAPDLSRIPNGVYGRVLTPFDGCIRKFVSQWKSIPLVKNNILEGRNVEDCDGSVCGGDVCQNGGTCHVNANNEFVCSCLKHYTGKRCEFRLSCREMQCQNGGRCAQERTLISQCHCPNGWGGPFCESGITIQAPRFGGNSYLLVERSETVSQRRRHTKFKVDVNMIYLNFTTAETNGMLLWSSRDDNTEFVGVGVEKGKIKIVWSKNDYNTTTLNVNETIADGNWHDLKISFESSVVTVWLDHETMYKSNETLSAFPLATDGRFFLGGFPDGRQVVNETLGHFQSGFDGCLQKLSWGGEMEIFNFSNFRGENIKTCDPFGL